MAAPEQIRIFLRNAQEYAQQHRSEIDNIVAEQRRSEEEIVQRGQFCPYQLLRDRIVTPEDASRALKEGFGDGQILQTLMCYNNSLLMFPEQAELGSSFKVREYLENLRQIGAPSVEGSVMSTTIRTPLRRQTANDRPFVVKVPKQLEGSSQILHEYFIGAYGTNSLRSRIPNFVYTMGLFRCSPPYIDTTKSDKPTLAYCQNDLSKNQVNYVVYENVTNSRSLQEVVLNCSLREYINILTQIVLALDMAHRELDYSHGDLHNGNVLIKSVAEEINIQYDSGSFLPTKQIATIIDPGRSHIVYNGKHYGFSFPAIGMLPERSYPVGDLYKLVMTSLARAAFGKRDRQIFNGLADDQINFTNPAVFQNAKRLVQYFHPQVSMDRVAQYIIDASQYYFDFPYYPEYNVRPLDFYAKAIVQLGNPLVSQPVHDRIYGCVNTGTCYTVEEAIQRYTHPQQAYNRDPYVFYETLYEAIGTPYLAQVLGEANTYYRQHMDRLRQDASKYLDELRVITQNISILSLARGAPDGIKFQPEYMQRYHNYVNRLVRASDILTSLEDIGVIMNEFGSRAPRQSAQQVPGTTYTYRQVSQMEIGDTRVMRSRLNTYLTVLREDLAYVNRLNPMMTTRQYPASAWLFTDFPVLSAAIA